MTLREMRERRGLTLREVADQIEDGPHYSTLARWERSNSVPVKYQEALADVLGVEAAAIRRLSQAVSTPTHQHVNSSDSLAAWQQRLTGLSGPGGIDDPNQLLVMLVLGQYLDRTSWVVSGTLAEIAQSAALPVGLVEDVWPQVLQSPFIERVGSAEWVLRLVFPKDEGGGSEGWVVLG